jgi:hypothetical protein
MVSLVHRFIILWLLALLVCIDGATAQSRLSVFNVSSPVPPTVKGRFIALDASGAPISGLKPGDFRVTENGLDLPVTLVSCNDATPPEPTSIAVSIDISRSMIESPVGGPMPITLATTFAREFAGLIQLPPSELALQTCDTWPAIVQDFTSDRTKFLAALSGVRVGGGNDFVTHLLDPLAGLLNIAKTGRTSRVAVLVTDAYWGAMTASQVLQCIDTCKRHKIKFYAIVCSPQGAGAGGIKSSLQSIAGATGGRMIEGVLTSEESRELALELHGEVQGEPCYIEWTSRFACGALRRAIVELPAYGLKDTVTYTVTNFDPTRVTRLEVTPASISFGPVPPGTTRDTSVVLTARGGPVTVGAITGSSALFTVTNGGAPPSFVINEGQSRTVKIRFSPIDSSLAFSQFTVISDACSGDAFYASGGYYRKGATQLALLAPNGGEEFPAGIDTAITWSGVLPEESVKLEYSTDAGTTWNVITANATGLRYPWKVPNTPSNRCLARVTQQAANGAILILPCRAPVTSVDISGDGRYVVTVSDSVRIWDAYSGDWLRTLSPDHLPHAAAFSPDGSHVVTGSIGGQTRLWSVEDGSPIKQGYWAGDINSVSYSRDGSKIITSGRNTSSKPVAAVVWDAVTLQQETTLLPFSTALSQTSYSADFSPDGTRVVSGGDQLVLTISNPQTGSFLGKIDYGNVIRSVRYSPDGSEIVIAGNKGVSLWNSSTQQLIRSLSPLSSNAIDYGSDGRSVILGAGQDAELWELYTGTQVRSFYGHTKQILSLRISQDGRRLVTGSEDGTARIWDLDEQPVQTDLSDTLWSIVSSRAEGRDIDFGKVQVGEFRDSTITGYVRNTGSVVLQVKQLRIAGPDGVDFTVVAGNAPFDIAPGDSAAVELRFKPSASGPRTGSIDIITQDGVLHQQLRGEGVTPVLQVIPSLVDFGNVGVGDKKDTVVKLLVKNVSTQPLTIDATPPAGPDLVQFSLLGGGGSFTLQPGEGRDVELRFAPLNVGRSSGGLAFEHIGGRAIAHLFGTGVTGTQPAIESVSTVNFQPIVCNVVAEEESVEVKNIGGTVLDISNATFSGVDASAYSFVTPFTQVSIAPGDNRQFALRFTPGHTGDHAATLTFTSNAANSPQHAIPLRGRRDSIAILPSLNVIDFGVLCPGEAADTTVSVTNAGTIRTGITATMSGGVVLSDSAWTVDATQSITVPLYFPATSVEGNVTGTVVLADTICGTTVSIAITGRVESPRVDGVPLAMEATPGSVADTLLTLTNPTGRDLTISSALPGDAQFSIDPSEFPLSIPAGASRTISVRYQPSDTLPVSTSLAIAGVPCTLTAAIPLEGTPRTISATATLALPEITGAPGDIVEVPVALRRGLNLQQAGVARFSGTLRFNATLLAPIPPTPEGSIKNGERIVPLELPSVPVHDSTLVLLRFRVMLGSDTSTVLHLESPLATGGSASVLTIPGRFVLLGVCRDGGTRLLNPDGVIALKSITPNPADGTVVIGFEIIEEGWTQISISDGLGRVVSIPVDGEMEPGEYALHVNASAFVPGIYFCTLRTPTTLTSVRMQIER